MRLMLVTFIPDNTQFLVNIDDEFTSAINYAIEANKAVGGIVDNSENGLTMKEVTDTLNYKVEDVDFGLLKEMFNRDDYMFSTAHAIVFND